MSRPASHSGSWYTADKSKLEQQLSGWIDHQPHQVKALIGPHAGLSYSGKTAGQGYQHLTGYKTVFLIGPSHVEYFQGIKTTRFRSYKSLVDIPIDMHITDTLLRTGMFSEMSQDTDIQEHSLEMHLPFICYMQQLNKTDFSLVPLLVGELDTQAAVEYAQILQPYFGQKDTLFVFSSDFCHWGKRFRYQPMSDLPIHEHIRQLDRQAMDLIENKDPVGFDEYLKRTKNTICGRNPIRVLLRLLRQQDNVRFVFYDQSSQVMDQDDSSVSYATAIINC